MNITLIGYRCSGKTTVGRALAKRLGWSFVDTDDLIVKRDGRTIAEIFALQGEAYFRDLETAVVLDVVKGERQVIGAGGGAILRDRNRKALRGAGKIVYLRCDEETILQRMRADEKTAAQRPALSKGKSMGDEIRTILAARQPIYESAADLIVDSARASVPEIVEEIMGKLALP